MFRQVLTSALFAGFAAGLIAAALQLVFVQPVLLASELYESGEVIHVAGQGSSAHVAWAFDPVRDMLSVLFTTLVYCGYGMLLTAAMGLAALRGVEITPRAGLIWGVAGFVALHLAPAFGLPPELPGSAAADLGARQVWWFSTVAATAIGLWLIAFGSTPLPRVIGALALAAPHLVGAPHPDTFVGPVPPELAGLFAARALGVGFVAWALLGTLAGWFWQREADLQAQEARGT